jgi:hypothetical protein
LERKAGDIAAGSRQTHDHTAADRVRRDRKNNRDDGCRLLSRNDSGSQRDNEFDFKADQLGGELGETLAVSLRLAILDRHCLTLDPAEFVQSLDKNGGPSLLSSRRIRAQKADGRLFCRLLRQRRERPTGRRTSNSLDEITPSHCIPKA